MSLLNEMLRDLEKRRQQGEGSQSCNEAPVVVTRTAAVKLLLLSGGVLLLAGVIWGGVQIVPGMLSIKPAVSTSSSQAELVPAVMVEKVSYPAVVKTDVAVNSTAVERPPALTEALGGEILDLEVVEGDASAQLSLVFSQLPEYRLLQNGVGVARLVVSFTQTRIGADFEIPALTGALLNRISLIPQKQTLQLLVDLDEGAQVQSFQVVDDPVQGYRLLIEIVAVTSNGEKKQNQLSTPETVVPVAEKTEASTAKVSKNKNRLSRDQQAHRAGLEQIQQGNLVAAEASFNQALIINPQFHNARLQLVRLLQQQTKRAKAEGALQQGLSLAPENTDFRKLYARLLLSDNRQDEAIKLLQAKPQPAVAQDLEYYALLAALYQESGQFVAASSTYGQLLQLRPQEALWWMGMAISLEQSDRSGSARDAYQKALQLSGLSPDLINYIQGRLQVL
ncbi:MAG: tetratricopeptide repeat protein [Thermodesulfobacteriota bacterium]|nr:tetratricopeptide repeat protein [Thermodesulfobacteriota bacterium]